MLTTLWILVLIALYYSGSASEYFYFNRQWDKLFYLAVLLSALTFLSAL